MPVFYGKSTGHMDSSGECSPDAVLGALEAILGGRIRQKDHDYEDRCRLAREKYAPARELQFCAGCPHRATYWAIKEALKLDGRDGVMAGDVGCYSMGLLSTGFSQVKTIHAMGSGIGLASGLGKLGAFGFDQPVVTICGDSTFFHAAIPGLVNAVHNQSDLVFVIVDNAGTAMTGFQPHPGVQNDAMGVKRPSISIDELCSSLRVPVVVVDPYNMEETVRQLLTMLRDGTGVRALICRRECALIRASKGYRPFLMHVDKGRCIGGDCGCNRYCTRVFRCPGLSWDRQAGRVVVDEAICTGCGVCADICPKGAILKEPN